MAPGTVSHAQALKGRFVTVKDSRNSHPGNLLWGMVGVVVVRWRKSHETTSTSYKEDCLACHVPAKATDWAYTPGSLAVK